MIIENHVNNDNIEALNNVYNTAFGERTSLNELTVLLKEYLSEFDGDIADVEIQYGPERKGDVPHSLASIDKAKNLLGYEPKFDIKSGLKEAVCRSGCSKLTVDILRLYASKLFKIEYKNADSTLRQFGVVNPILW